MVILQTFELKELKIHKHVNETVWHNTLKHSLPVVYEAFQRHLGYLLSKS